MSQPPLPDSVTTTPDRPPWTGRDVAAGVAFLLLGYVVVVASAVVAGAVLGDPDTDSAAALAVAVITLGFELWLFALVAILADRRRLELPQLGFVAPRGGPGWWWPVLIVLGAWGILLAYFTILTAIQSLTGVDLDRLLEGNSIPDNDAMTDLVWVFLGLSIVVAAPLGEELFFRGLLFQGFRPRLGLWGAMAASGALFALVHFEISVVLPFWAIGVWFAWAYYRSGSLWTTVLAHAIFNGISFAVTISAIGTISGV